MRRSGARRAHLRLRLSKVRSIVPTGGDRPGVSDVEECQAINIAVAAAPLANESVAIGQKAKVDLHSTAR